jgi:hypothetical protein
MFFGLVQFYILKELQCKSLFLCAPVYYFNIVKRCIAITTPRIKSKAMKMIGKSKCEFKYNWGCSLQKKCVIHSMTFFDIVEKA